MVNLSKTRIDKEVYSKIYSQFISSLVNLDKQKSVAFIDELFTESEKLMLAKRLAIIFMLREGLSNRVIRDSLNVSPSTVTRISGLLRKKKNLILGFDHGEIRKLIKKILIIRHELLPSRPRSTSWKYLHDNKSN